MHASTGASHGHGAPGSAPAPPHPEVRKAVKDLLTQSPAFAALNPEKQQQVARDTALVADYLANPEGIPGNTLGTAGGETGGGVGEAFFTAGAVTPETSYEDAAARVDEIGGGDFRAGAAREGAEVAGLLMEKVNFPQFVAGLIDGVFNAIVESSIKQMEAYSTMVEQVAKSLQQFRDENVTENQGRDHMVERFPELFDIGVDDFSDQPSPRLRLREGVDERRALDRVRTSMSLTDGELKSMDLSDENVERVLVVAARTQLARQRQQLLASMVLMGINRIVVTDGRIHAKIMYDFRAQDRRRLARSAQAADYAKDAWGNVQKTRAHEGEYDHGGDYDEQIEKESANRDSSYYTKGTYKYSEAPILSAMSTARETTDERLSTRAQLAGTVEVNFKSDYLPLEKMASPRLIAAIQGHSKPVDPNTDPALLALKKDGAGASDGTSSGAQG